MQTPAVAAKALHGPSGKAEEAQFPGRRRIHGQPIGVVRMALGFAHVVGIAVFPYAALAQQPVGCQPSAGQKQRRPPSEGGQHQRGRDAGQKFHQTGGDEVHGDGKRRPADAEVEIACHGDVVGQFGIFQVGDAGRFDAGDRQLIVEPSGGLESEVCANGLMQRRKHLQQHEDRTG